MASLRNSHNGTRIMLRPLHVFGRNPSVCRTVLRGADVSKIHALVRWHLQRWEIVDQSRNGTFVDGIRLPPDTWRPLTSGSDIVFAADVEACWRVHDVTAPANCLFPLTGDDEVLELHPEGMFLPSLAHPEVHLYWNNEQWLLEDEQDTCALSDGAVVQVSAQRWELVLCPELGPTVAAPRADDMAAAPDLFLHFEIASNEEHARLRLQLRDQVIDLGERIHHYLLATLARLRLQHAERGIEPHAQGWVATEALARMLGVDLPYVNIQIFRAREQFAQALAPATAAPLPIERRRGEVRLASCRFMVQRGAKIEGSCM